jgi:hypothetical protein
MPVESSSELHIVLILTSIFTPNSLSLRSSTANLNREIFTYVETGDVDGAEVPMTMQVQSGTEVLGTVYVQTNAQRRFSTCQVSRYASSNYKYTQKLSRIDTDQAAEND